MRSPRHRAILFAACASLALGVGAKAARADEATSSAKVSALIQVVKERPAGVDRETWREDRRDAARELGSLGDTKAVPALIEIVRSESFDAVSGIAIVSLGKLGDARAIPILKQVAADPSRDSFSRSAARDSLEKLGETQPVSAPEKVKKEEEKALATTGLGGSATPAIQSVPASPQAFADDLLAASDRLGFSIGESHLGYDSVTNEAFFDGQATLSYLRIREGQSLALRYEGRSSLLAGAINYDGDDSSSKLIRINAAGSAEARMYTQGGSLFGIGIGSALAGADYLRIHRPNDDNTSTTQASGELAIGLGGGYGRILNTGESLRVSRLENVLRKFGALGRPISPALSDTLMGIWWQFRNETGYHKRLQATLVALKEAGALLNPSSEVTYGILQVLQDGQLSERLSGFQVFLALGESVLLRDDDLNLEEGRIESVFSRASFGKQSQDGLQELRVDGFARLRILAEDNERSPWALGVISHLRRFHYGSHFDPLGALDISAEVGASSLGAEDSEIATKIAGSVGWLWAPSRASQIRLAGQLRYESSNLFMGLVLDGRLGLLDAGFHRASRQ